MKNKTSEYTDELKRELDKRYADYKRGKVKLITAEESKRRTTKLLKKYLLTNVSLIITK